MTSGPAAGRLDDRVVAIGPESLVEGAWRVLLGDGGDRRRLLTRSAMVRGREGLCELARTVAVDAWGGELRLRVYDVTAWTRVLDVHAWPSHANAPCLRADGVWRAEETRRAAALSFLSQVRPVIELAGRQGVVHRRDAGVLLALAKAACEGPISSRRAR